MDNVHYLEPEGNEAYSTTLSQFSPYGELPGMSDQVRRIIVNDGYRPSPGHYHPHSGRLKDKGHFKGIQSTHFTNSRFTIDEARLHDYVMSLPFPVHHWLS